MPTPDAVSTPLAALPDQSISVIAVAAWAISTWRGEVTIHTTERRIITEDSSFPRALLLAGLVVRAHRAEHVLRTIANALADDDQWTSDTIDDVGRILVRAGYLTACPTCGFAASPSSTHHCH